MASVVALFVMALPLRALAAVDSTAVAAVDSGAINLRDTLVEIATTVLPYAVAIIAILLGWRMARRFIRA